MRALINEIARIFNLLVATLIFGIHSLQGCTATMKHKLQEKEV